LKKQKKTKLENEEICKVFQTEMGRLTQLTDINENHTIESVWETKKTSLQRHQKKSSDNKGKLKGNHDLIQCAKKP